MTGNFKILAKALTSSLEFFQKKLRFLYQQKCLHWYWLFPPILTCFWRNVNIFSIFLFFSKVDFNKYTTGASGDDAVHKNLHKMKKTWAEVWYWFILKFYRIRYKKKDAILVQCPFKLQSARWFQILDNSAELHIFEKKKEGEIFSRKFDWWIHVHFTDFHQPL